MKYSYCYTFKKILKKDEKKLKSTENDIHFDNDEESEIEFECGPWRKTKEEAIKDKELFQKDKDAFLKKNRK